MIPYLARAKRVSVSRCASVAPGENLSHSVEGLSPTRARIAQPSDLDGLVEFYSHYELEIAPTVRRVREVLTPLVHQRRVAIVEHDGRIVAAQQANLRSRKYQVLSSLAVEPAARGQSLSLDLSVTQGIGTEFLGLGSSGTRASTNRRRWGEEFEHLGESEVWLEVMLATPHRPFRGYELGSRVLERLERRVSRRSAQSSRS